MEISPYNTLKYVLPAGSLSKNGVRTLSQYQKQCLVLAMVHVQTGYAAKWTRAAMSEAGSKRAPHGLKVAHEEVRDFAVGNFLESELQGGLRYISPPILI